MNCKNCKYWERSLFGKCEKIIFVGGQPRNVLGSTSSIHPQETFGCIHFENRGPFVVKGGDNLWFKTQGFNVKFMSDLQTLADWLNELWNDYANRSLWL